MKFGRFFRTVRHLKLGQVIARFRFKFRRIKFDRPLDYRVRLVYERWATPIQKNIRATGSDNFQILNTHVRICSAADWNSSQLPKLVLYHLHYHDVINSVHGPNSTFDSVRFIESWIRDNPPAKGNGWEPYPLSLRIVNWIKWQLAGNELSESQLENLFLQARVLAQQVEYHLLANHLFANAKALYFAGLFFGGNEAKSWRIAAENILRRELVEQFLNDGGHFELSPMYQATMAEDVLDLININNAFRGEDLADLPEIAKKMIRWLNLMSHNDGLPSYFNDSTFGVAPLLADLASYSQRLNLQTDLVIDNGLHYLRDSGYVRYEADKFSVILDIGRIGPDYQPGHGHCDCLSFELSSNKGRHLVNSGVSTYENCPQRLLERMTSAHNTVAVGDQDQSEVWSAFRVGRRAVPFDVKVDLNSVSAAHDGFDRLGVVHRRSFEFSDCRVILIDRLEGEAPAHGIAYFHFAPNSDPVLVDKTVQSGPLRLIFEKATTLDLQDYSYCEGFNLAKDAKVLLVHFTEILRTECSYENPVYH